MITKGFFTELGEVVDRHRTLSSERRSYTAAALPHRPTARFRWLLPTPGNVLLTILVIGSLLWAQKAGALSLYMPTAAITSTAGLPYQGRLADKNGAPLTQTVNMIFRLYSAASGGSPLWEEQWTGSNSVQVSDGLFNVMLGSLTPIPQSVITGNSNLFLGITVGTDSEMSPRVQLGSVPFATQALTVPDGSITKAKLATDVILEPSRKLTRVAPPGTVNLPNANTWYDIVPTTISLQKETLVTIHASVGLQNGTDTFFASRIVIDGTPHILSHQWHKGGVGEQHMLTTAILLSPGQHEIKLQGYSALAGSIANGDERTQMIIVEG